MGDVHDPRFVAALRALALKLDEIVVIGGSAQRLFRLHSLANKHAPLPIETKDADLAVPATMRGDLGALLSGAHFERRLVGTATPRKSTFWPTKIIGNEDEFHIEFLTPRMGGARGDGAVVVAGISAEALPHLDMLLEATWTVRLADLDVRIPNPARYMAHKLVVLEQRKEKRANDVRYLHDTIQCFGDSLPALRELGASISWPKETRRRFVRGRALAAKSDLRARAAQVQDIGGESVSIDAFSAALDLGLAAIFD